MKTLTILFIVTSHAMMGSTNEPTGLWLEELSTPYYAFIEAGYEVEIVSVSGGEIPIDPRSVNEEGENPESVTRFLNDETAMKHAKNTKSIEGLDTSKYAAVFIPGGHGTMFDMPENETLANIVSSTLADDRIVAAVCHGPAALVSAVDENGTPIVKGKKIATFTNAEEDAVGLTDDMPFLLETRLKELGANVTTAPNFEAHSVVDGNLVTGQNPPSSEAAAKLVIKLLEEKHNK